MQRRWLISFLLILLTGYGQCQNQQNDLKLLIDGELQHNNVVKTRKVKWMEPKSKNYIIMFNPVNTVFSSLMYCYQKILSPQMSSSCIYTPSCSNFSKQLIHEYGLIKGIFLSADRIMRCNRVSAADISPLNVDEHFHLAKDNPMSFKNKSR